MITKDHKAHLRIVASRDARYAVFLSLPEVEIAAPLRHLCPFTRPAIRFDHHNLCPGLPGIRFNPSLIASGNGYLFAYRSGWAGSNIYAVRLNAHFQPIADAKLLALRNRASRFGREDSRFFRLNGKLHIVYIGVAGTYGPTNVCFARINEDTLDVEDKFHPKIPGRQPWEKNHSYFDIGGVAHAVYSLAPHRILRIEGTHAEFVANTPTQVAWSGGRLCGGASPVLHQGLWYHFFHGSTDWNGRRQYNMGLACFEATHPYRIVRFSPHPLDVADPTVPHDNHCDVLFPGGAVLVGNQWVIAHGVHDRYSELRFYDAAWVESQLEDVA